MQSLLNFKTECNKSQLNWDRFNSAFIIEVSRGSEVFTSTAVAIAPGLAITAAHCIDCADEVVILLGEDYKKPDHVLECDHWIIHPGYDPRNSFYENDIAIIYLIDQFPRGMNYEVLEDSIHLDHKSLIERIGFGGRENQNIKTWTNPNFQSITFNKKNFILNDNSSVIGDSGGPVYKEEQGVLKLIGIHSTLEKTDHGPITYIVNTAFYKDWIMEHLKMNKAI